MSAVIGPHGLDGDAQGALALHRGQRSFHAVSSRTRKRYPSWLTSTGMPCSAEKPRIIGMLASDRRTLTSVVNCWRNPPAHAPVEPRPGTVGAVEDEYIPRARRGR